MISDFVKGKKKFDYPPGIQKGIQLHRDIDNFTDTHPITKKAKQLFSPVYRLYAGAFMDIVYDHFLANDTNSFDNDIMLNLFCQDTYAVLKNNFNILPPPFQKMFPYMELHNWLYNYRLKEGIEKSFGGLVRRAAYLSESTIAYEIFISNQETLSNYYQSFFPDLKNFTVHQLNQLNGN